MNHFHYRNGLLHAEDVAIPEIAALVGTPFYLYSTATLTRHYRVFADALAAEGLRATVCFAVKANANLSVLRTLANLGAGADVVSEGELRQALLAGVPAEKIVFSGVGKSDDEMALALQSGILQLNVESFEELERLSAVATRLGRPARIAVRMNPDVDARTHDKISTGRKGDKFGVAFDRLGEIYARARALPGIEPVSLAMHIGSQLTELDPCRRAFARMAEAAERLLRDGTPLRHLDLGGGLGIPYRPGQETPPPAAYARAVRDSLGALDLPLLLEPGRMICGNAGVLVARVIGTKQAEDARFVIVDAAMNDLIRPAMYDGHHEILPVQEAPADTLRTAASVVGPVCESADIFARDRLLPPLKAGDLVAFMTAGAYGAVMASTYNSRRLVPEVLVKGSRHAVVRPRQSWEDLLGRDRVADWL